MTLSNEQDQNRAQLLLLRGVLSELPKAQQKKIEAIAGTIRRIIEANGDEGLMALALVGAEEACKS
jgi:hypothetical protein